MAWGESKAAECTTDCRRTSTDEGRGEPEAECSHARCVRAIYNLPLLIREVTRRPCGEHDWSFKCQKGCPANFCCLAKPTFKSTYCVYNCRRGVYSPFIGLHLLTLLCSGCGSIVPRNPVWKRSLTTLLGPRAIVIFYCVMYVFELGTAVRMWGSRLSGYRAPDPWGLGADDDARDICWTRYIRASSSWLSSLRVCSRPQQTRFPCSEKFAWETSFNYT